MQQVSVGQYDASIDVEMLQEILYVYWRRHQLNDALVAFDDLITIFLDPIAVTAAEMRGAHLLMETYPRLSPRDAIHAAVVQVHRLEGIVSADRVYDEVKELRRFDPLEMQT